VASGLPAWLVIAGFLFGTGGIGTAWLSTRAMRKVEGVKSKVDYFDKLAQRQDAEVERKDRELAAKDARIAELERRVAELEARGGTKKG
jgi:hypothetical protein